MWLTTKKEKEQKKEKYEWRQLNGGIVSKLRGAEGGGKEKKIIDFHLKKAISTQVLLGKQTVCELLTLSLCVCVKVFGYVIKELVITCCLIVFPVDNVPITLNILCYIILSITLSFYLYIVLSFYLSFCLSFWCLFCLTDLSSKVLFIILFAASLFFHRTNFTSAWLHLLSVCLLVHLLIHSFSYLLFFFSSVFHCTVHQNVFFL